MGALINAILNPNVGPYRPPNWSRPQLYSMTCTLPSGNATTATVTTSQTVDGQPVPNAPGIVDSSSQQFAPAGTPTTYFFDAVLRADHTQELVCTEHPVQIGPAIVDHAYLRPARVVLEIAMSDAMASYRAGQYSSGKSKSISAYLTFKKIQAARVAITLATRLDKYKNMVLEDVRATDDNRTVSGFRGTLHFRQIISAQISTSSVSVRPDATDTTDEGSKATTTVSPDLMNTITGLKFQ